MIMVYSKLSFFYWSNEIIRVESALFLATSQVISLKLNPSVWPSTGAREARPPLGSIFFMQFQKKWPE